MKTPSIFSLSYIVLSCATTESMYSMKAAPTVKVQTQLQQPLTLVQSAFVAIKRAIDAEVQNINTTISFDQWYAAIERNYFLRIAPDLMPAFENFYIRSKVGAALWKHGPEEEPYHNIVLSNGEALFGDNHFFWMINGQRMRMQLPADSFFLKEIKPGLLLFSKEVSKGSTSSSLHLFNTTTQEISTFDEEHWHAINGVYVLSENLFITYGYDRQLKLWDVNSKKCIRTIPANAQLAFVHFDGSHLIGVGQNVVMRWTFPDFKQESVLPGPSYLFNYRCSLLSENSFISLHDYEKTLSVYNLKTAELRYKRRLKPREVGPSVGSENFHLACPLDADTFAVITTKGSLHIYDIETGTLQQVLDSVDKNVPGNLVVRNNALIHSIECGAQQCSFIRHTCKSLLQDAYNAAQAKNKKIMLHDLAESVKNLS